MVLRVFRVVTVGLPVVVVDGVVVVGTGVVRFVIIGRLVLARVEATAALSTSMRRCSFGRRSLMRIDVAACSSVTVLDDLSFDETCFIRLRDR